MKLLPEEDRKTPKRRRGRIHVPQFDQVIAVAKKPTKDRNPWKRLAKKEIKRYASTEKLLAELALMNVPHKRVLSALRLLRDEIATVTKQSRRKGRAKGRGQSSKAKGRSAV